MISRGRTRANARNHDDLVKVPSSKGVSEDHGELGAPVGHVAVGALGGVEGPNALLEGQERLVDFRAFLEPVVVVPLAVLRPFRASQVRKEKSRMGNS